MKKITTRRFMAWVLTAAMLIGMLPMNALADKGDYDMGQIPVAKGTSSVKNTHTYIFVDVDEVDRQIVKDGEYLVEPKAPEKANHKFVGWFDESDNQIDFSQSISVEQADPPVNTNFTIDAKFEKIYYVDFVYNSEVLKTKSVAPNGTVDASDVPLNVTEEGKVFSHWSETENGTTAFDFSTPITANMTLYAVTKDAWTVTFDSEGGSAVLPKHVVNNEEIGTLESPTRAGYTFKHWSLSEGGIAIPADYTVTQNITLYAVWEAATNTSYKVVYWQENAEDDGYTFEEVVYKTGTTGATATYDSKSYTGFHFSHADDKTISANGDTVVNVYYKRDVHTFTIEYRTGSGWSATWHTYSTTQLKYGQSTATQYNAAVAAYPYYSWYVSRTSNTAYSEAPAMPNANLTVHGRYSGSSYLYTIGYYEQGTNPLKPIKDSYSFYSGSGSLSFTIEDGINIPGFTVTPMSQWDRLKPNQVSKIYYTRNNYDLTFNKNNNTPALVVQNIPFESDISNKDTTGLDENSTFVQDGITYYFAGWYDNSACEGTPYSLAGKKMPAHNLALYAKWTPETYTVTYYKTLNPGGGVHYEHKDIIPLNKTTPPASNPPGTDFKGWYWYLGDFFVKFDFETPISGNFELYPVFGSQTAQVTYDANGGGDGAPEDNIDYLVGAEAIVKNAPTTAPDNQVFLRWNTAADGSGSSYMPNSVITVPTGGVTLYAQWGVVPKKVNLVYNYNYGEDPATKTFGPYAVNSTVTVKSLSDLEWAVPTDYRFVGWNTKADGSGVSYGAGASVMIDANGPNVLYATWAELIPIVITIKGTTKTVTYTGSEQSNSEYTVSYTESGNPATGLPEGLTLNAPTDVVAKGTNVGTYTATLSDDQFSVTGDELYKYKVSITIEEANVELKVTKAPVTIRTGSGEKEYDGTPLTNAEASITGLVNNETATVTATGSQTEVGSSTNTYSIAWGTTDSDNYEITETLGTLTVTINETTEVKLIAADAEKVYDGTELTKTDGVTWEGLPDGFTVVATSSGSQTNAGSSDNVVNDDYAIKDGNGVDQTANFTNVLKVPGTLKVTKAPLTITTGSAEKEYDGTALTNAEASITGLVNNETATVTATGSRTEVGNSTNTYSIAWGTTDSDNYEITETLGTLTVTINETTEVKLIAADAEKVYDGTELTKTDGVTWEGLPDGFTVVATSSGSQTNAGSSDNVVNDDYAIKDGNGVDQTANFTNVLKVPGTLKVTKAPLTITTGSAEKEYDGTALTNAEASITGLVNNETATVTATGSRTEVGNSTNTYSIAWGTTDSDNYEITETLGTLTVTINETTEVKLIAADAEKVYDGTELTKTDGVTWEGLPDGFTVVATSSGSQTNAGSSDNVVNDDYAIKDGNGVDQTANFTNVLKVPGTLKVTKAPLTITTGSAEKEYDGTALTNAEASITGLVNNETATVTATGSRTEVGNSTNTYSIAWGTTDSDNYEITETLGTLTVTINETTEVKLIAADAEKVYDGTELTKTDGVTWEGLPDGFTVVATSSGSQTNAGSSDNVVNDDYAIKDGNGVDQTANFTNVLKVPGTLKVTKAPLTITTGSAEKEYDGTALTNAEASITGLVNNETATVTATGSRTEVGNSTNTYSIAWGTTDSDNYEITETLGTLTVTINETTEVKLIAADAEKVYDGTELTKTDGVTWEGLPDGFTVVATSSGSQTNAGSSDNVVNDDYAIKDGNGVDQTANFTNVLKVPGTLKVTKAPLTITTGSAEKEYDGTALTNAEASITGLVNNETATVTATGSRTEVGNSTNTYSIAWGTTDSDNYEITETLGTLTVTINETTEVKLIAADAEKVYDGTELTKTDGVTWEGLPDGFTVVATSSGSQTNAGSSDNVVNDDYAIKDGNGVDQTANFTNVLKVPGTLKVTKAPLTITTGSAEKEYDGTALTNAEASITGLVNNETATVTATGSRTEVGNSTNTYSIAWGTTDSDNYEITETLGTLTVTINETTEVKLIAADAEKVYDGTELTKTDGVTWEGLPDGFTVVATSSGSQTNAGSSDNVVNDDYAIKDGNGVDQTANFTNVLKVPGTLKVTKAPLTITTGSAEKEYDGTALTNAEASITGLVNNETATVTATGSRTEVGNSTNTYSIAWGTTDSDNYEITETLGTLTVTINETTEVKLIAADAEKVYDGTELTKTDGVTWEGLPDGFTVVATSSGSQTNAGSSDNVVNDDYAIKDGNGVDQTANFTNVLKVPGTLKVTKAPLTITTGSAEKEYDGTALTNAEASITGLVNNETATVTATGSRTEVGNSTNTYSIAWGTTDSDNYEITETLGTLTVTINETTEVKLIAADAEKVYDGTELTKTDGVTWEGLPDGFTVVATSSGSQTNAGSSDNVVNDDYAIKDGNGVDQTANFTNVLKVPGTLKVTKAPLTITTGSAEKEYDGTALTNAEASITGLVNNETATVTATGSRTEVGNSTNTYSIAWGTTDSDNYEITETLGTLTVTINETTEVKLIAADAEKVYDGTELTKTDGVTWEGLPDGFTVVATSSGSQTNAGSSDNVVNDDYAIKDGNGVDQTANFTNVLKVPGTLKVTKAPLTITTGSAEKEYDGTALTNAEASITGLVNNETATVTATGSRTEVGNSTNTYSIAWGTTDSDNYEITETLGTLTVTINETTEVKLIAADAEKVYDGTELTKTDGVTWEGLPDGFTVVATSSGSQTNAGSSDNVVNDDYAIKDGNGVDQTANFTNVLKVPGTLKVTKAPLTITTGSAEKEYDGTALTNAEASITGLVNNETATVTATGSRTEVGNSTNTYSIAWGTTDSDNYEITETLGTLTVTINETTEVKLIAADAEKVYDGTELTKTDGVTWEGLPDGFTVVATSSGSQTNAGSSDNVVNDDYAIKDGNGVDQTANFTNVLKVPGTLKVTKAPLTITTGSAEKEYDGTALTNAEASITGLVNNETATVTATGSRTEVGNSTNTYSIAWGTTDSDNYEITETLGTLTVTINETTEVKLIAADAEKVYDGTELTKTDGVTWEGLPDGFTVVATSSGSQTNAGSSDNVVNDDYAIKDGNGVDQTANFTNVLKVPGTLKVTKAPLTITTGSAEKEYDGTALTEGTATITGLVTGESVTLTATGSQTEVGSSDNTYTIAWDNALAGNYTVTNDLGTLKVTKSAAKVKLIAADAEKVYDGIELSKTDDVTWDGLPAGFTVEASSAGEQTNVGESANVVNDGYVIKDANGVEQTANFTNVTKVDGTLKVTSKAVTIKTGSAEKEYDGTALTEGTATITGLVTGESVTLTATGSQTEVGDSDNTYSITWDYATAANYTVTDNLGTLTVTTSAAEVLLTAPSDSKTYDGTALTKTTGVTWSGLPTGFTVEATATGSQTDAGSSANVVDDGYVIKNSDGDDKTANFTNVTKIDGTLEITRRAVTLTSATDSKVYDGTALTNDTVTVTGDGWAKDEGATYNVTGSQLDAGTSYNSFSYTLNAGTLENNYIIGRILGKLTVSAVATEIVITAASDSKPYDGTPLTNAGYTFTESVLVEGDVLTAVVEGTITDVGTADNVVKSYKVMRGTTDVTKNYTFGESVKGKLTITQDPHIALEKTVDRTNLSAAGDVIYTYTIKNTGNVPLTNLSVTDDKISGTIIPVLTELAPNASTTATATYTITQAMMDAGDPIVNIATASGLAPDRVTTVTSEEATATVEISQEPSMTVTKSADKTSYDTVGEEITYTIEVTNTGNVTLTNLVLTDALMSAAPATRASLAVGETWTIEYTYTVTQDDLDAGSITNAVAVTSDETGEEDPTDDQHEIPADQKPAMTVEKSADKTSYDTVGEEITYKIDVRNAGNITLTNLVLTDALMSVTPATRASLAVGETWTVEYTYTVTQDDLDAGSITNAVAVTSDETGEEDPTDDQHEIPADQKPAMTVAKSADKTSYDTVGEEIKYTIEVTNNGNVTLTNLVLTDVLMSATAATRASLAVGEIWTVEYTYTVTQDDLDAGSITNAVAVTSDETGEEDPTDDQHEIPAVQNPAMTVEKSADKDSYATVGEEITYKIDVKNTGKITLTNLVLTDALMSATPATRASLAVGETWTVEYTYTVTQDDLDAGSITNAVAVTSDETGEEDPTDDQHEIPAVQNPAMTVEKSADKNSYAAVGEEITYKIDVKNTGNTTLKNLEITDTLVPFENMTLTGDTNSDGHLDVGETWTLTYIYTVTQDDLDAGKVLNKVAVTKPANPDNPDEPALPPTEDEHVVPGPAFLDIETTINPTKSLAGRALTAGEFTFELRQGGAVLQSAANDAEGNILFTPLVYTEEDIGQTYSYTIVEIAGIEADMAYSTMAIDFTVLVEDAGDGVLSLTVSAPADVTFFNVYTPPAPAPVPDPVPVPNFDLGAVSGNVADCLE